MMYSTIIYIIYRRRRREEMIALIIIAVILLIIIACGVRVVPQTKIYIIERLGKYKKSWDAGIHVKIPIIDNVVNKVSLKEKVLDFPPQGVITKDNVAMSIDSVVYMCVTDAKLFTYGVENPIAGVENLCATTLRNIIGTMDLDTTLSGRDQINKNLEAELDAATDKWGIKINRVEVKTIQPPKDILDVMSKQMRAERERRQTVLEAEAHKESSVKRAEGDKAAKVLAAEAERDAQIALAEGKARSIKMVYEAEAEGIERLNKAQPSNQILRMKGIEAMKDIANGNSTKVFIPSSIMDSVGDTIGDLSIKAEAFDIGNNMPINKKTKEASASESDPATKADSSKVTKEVQATGAQQRGEVEENYANMEFKY